MLVRARKTTEQVLLKLLLKNYTKNFRVIPFHLYGINCTSNAHFTGICIYMRYCACENSHPCSPRISKQKQFLWRSTVALGLGYGEIRNKLQNRICRWHDAQYKLHYAYIPVSLFRTEIMLTILKDILGFWQLPVALIQSTQSHSLKYTKEWVNVKVKQSRYRPGVAQRVPGS
jgi:hypothetical protein